MADDFPELPFRHYQAGADPTFNVFVYRPDQTSEISLPRFRWTNGAVSATVGLDETIRTASEKHAP